VSPLRVLFLGGSGIISSACCRLAVQRGLDLYALNRGATQLRPLPAEVKILHGDIVIKPLSDRRWVIMSSTLS
jgi:nucleoside-diphosphate-sugar epimerase